MYAIRSYYDVEGAEEIARMVLKGHVAVRVGPVDRHGQNRARARQPVDLLVRRALAHDLGLHGQGALVA